MGNYRVWIHNIKYISEIDFNIIVAPDDVVAEFPDGCRVAFALSEMNVGSMDYTFELIDANTLRVVGLIDGRLEYLPSISAFLEYMNEHVLKKYKGVRKSDIDYNHIIGEFQIFFEQYVYDNQILFFDELKRDVYDDMSDKIISISRDTMTKFLGMQYNLDFDCELRVYIRDESKFESVIVSSDGKYILHHERVKHDICLVPLILLDRELNYKISKKDINQVDEITTVTNEFFERYERGVYSDTIKREIEERLNKQVQSQNTV